jgi:hypothetical protein
VHSKAQVECDATAGGLLLVLHVVLSSGGARQAPLTCTDTHTPTINPHMHFHPPTDPPTHNQTPPPPRSGRLWSRLETTAELRDYLVRSPFVKYAGYGFEQQQPPPPPPPADPDPSAAVAVEGKGGSDTGGVCEAGGCNGGGKGKAKGKGKEGVYWFAEFGARNLHIGGPIQALESVIVESMKPWRPDQVLDVRYDVSGDAVQLRWCPEEIIPHASAAAAAAAAGQSLLAEEAGAVGGGGGMVVVKKRGEAGGCELRWSGSLKERIG